MTDDLEVFRAALDKAEQAVNCVLCDSCENRDQCDVEATYRYLTDNNFTDLYCSRYIPRRINNER